jgi:hypothetical protein
MARAQLPGSARVVGRLVAGWVLFVYIEELDLGPAAVPGRGCLRCVTLMLDASARRPPGHRLSVTTASLRTRLS